MIEHRNDIIYYNEIILFYNYDIQNIIYLFKKIYI